MRFRSFVLSVLAMLQVFSLLAQDDPIYLTNASFEDMPRHSKPPQGWYDCGFEYESPPDVQPSGTFSVTKPAYDGNTYLGMVVRDNDTWERVSQPLSRPMEKGKCYQFSIYLCRSELYVSVSKLTETAANYTTPAKLRIWGGFSYCDKKFLLAETNPVINYRWLQYEFKFEPDADYSYITLEAFYNTPIFPYNGNILVDNASNLVEVPCDEEQIAEEIEEPTPDKQPEEVVINNPPKNDPKEVPPPVTTSTPAQDPVVEEKTPVSTSTPKETPKEVLENVTFNEIKREEIKKGTIIRTNQIFFPADKSEIRPASYQVLDQLYAFLKDNPDLIIEIGGHTNGLPPDDYCDRLSRDRAKAVVDYLVEKGILANRLKYKGYGKRFLIASDDSLEGRQKNQRVEIKIL